MQLEVRFQDVTVFGEQACAVQVTEQSERNFKAFTASNGWVVQSNNRPEISDHRNKIWLRGCEDKFDNNIMFTRHPADVKQAIREFAEHVRDGKREEPELPFEVLYDRTLLARCCDEDIAEDLVNARVESCNLPRCSYKIRDRRVAENVIRNF